MQSNLSNANSQMQQLANNAVISAKDKFGIILDYSENSLQQLEILLQKAHERYKQGSSSGNSQNISIENTIRVWGSYFGEVIRRSTGGDWVTDQKDIFLQIGSQKINPLGQVRSRIVNGPQYNLQGFYQGISAGFPNNEIANSSHFESYEKNFYRTTSKQASTKRNLFFYTMGGVGLLFLIGICIVGVLLVYQGGLFIKSIKIPLVSQSPEKAYAQSMGKTLQDVNDWWNGPVAQEIAIWVNPYGDGSVSDYTNAKALAFYYVLPQLVQGAGGSLTTAYNEQDQIRVDLANALLPTENAIKSKGFDVLTELGGSKPPDVIQVAHNQIIDCVNYQINLANRMIVFLNTGNDSSQGNAASNNDPCALMQDAILKVTEFVQKNR